MKKRRITGISILKNKNVAVLGFGSQGKAQANNLRDSGIIPVIGLPARSRSKKKASAEKFLVKSPSKTIEAADVIAVLIPDHKHKELFDNLPDSLLRGKALIFAHGLSVAFGLVNPPADCDVILIAPHGPGVRLRQRYTRGESFTVFVAAKQDYSGNAQIIARAYAAAIGSPPGNQFRSTFEDEAASDIFGEQAVLCGGLVGLMETGFETLLRKGHSPESAYLECIYQIDLIVDLIKSHGPAGMFERISKTAAFGSMRARRRLFDSGFSGKMERLYDEIKSGRFAADLLRENKKGMKNYNAMLKYSRKSALQKTHLNLTRKLFRSSFTRANSLKRGKSH